MSENNGTAVDTYERDGGPAFPAVINDEDEPHPVWFEGMTLRDFFAAASLTGIKSNPELCRICADHPEGKKQQDAIAQMAYVDADAMIKARQ